MIDYAYSIGLFKSDGLSVTEPLFVDLLYESLSSYGASIQDKERGDAAVPTLEFQAWATPELHKYLKGVTNPATIYVELWEADLCDKLHLKRRFMGRLTTMPERGKDADNDVYTFNAAGLLSFANEVDVIDPVSAGAYEDTHIIDLIDAVLDGAGIFDRSINIKDLTASEPFCSRLFRPRKHRISGAYDPDSRAQAITNDGTLIYLGVGNWLCSYDPTTQTLTHLASLRYVGSNPELKRLSDTQWTFHTILYDAGTIYGWASNTYGEQFGSIRDFQAHVKISFTWAAGAYIDLTDAHLIYNYDKGYEVKSKSVQYNNYGGDGYHWATGVVESIGDAKPPWDKTLGTPWVSNRMGGTIAVDAHYNDSVIRVNPLGQPIYKHDIMQVRNISSQRQNLGEVLEILDRQPNVWTIRVTFPCKYNYPAGSEVYWWKSEGLPSSNIFLPGYRDIKITYSLANDSDPDGENVVVERRRTKEGRDSYYWPEIRGDVSDRDTIPVSDALIALSEGKEPGLYKTVSGTPDTTYYQSGRVPKFNIQLDGKRFSNQPLLGYYVENEIQAGDRLEAPGLNVLMYNGAPVTIPAERGAILEAEGNIWLSECNGVVYCAFNRWRRGEGTWFYQLVWGELAAGIFNMVGKDRTYLAFQGIPAREITGFIYHDGKYWFGVERVEPRWVHTYNKIIWAAPPQLGDKPADYDGGVVAVCMVNYDKTDILLQGTTVRVGELGAEPGVKEYLVSESEVLESREINNTNYSSQTYSPEERTYFTLHSVNISNLTYAQAVRTELLDKYLTIQMGVIKRGEICYAVAGTLTVSKDGSELWGRKYEGELYQYEKEDWKGEQITAEEEGQFAVLRLSGIPTGATPTVTLKTGKVEFTIEDKSSDPALAVPPIKTGYLRRYEGDDYNEAIIYLSSAYLDMEFDVSYSHYPERHYIVPFVRNNTLYFTETETNALYKYDAGWTRVDHWAEEPLALTVLDNDVYVLSVKGLLMKYGLTWPGYVLGPIGGSEKLDAFTEVAELARAADCFCGEENGRAIVKARDVSADSVVLSPGIVGYENLKRIMLTQFDAVIVQYAEGEYYYGPEGDVPNDRIYKLAAPLVESYGHAGILAKKYFDYYNSGTEIYEIGIGRETIDIPILGEQFAIPTIDGDIIGRLLDYYAKEARMTVLLEKTRGERLEIIEPSPITGEIWA